MGRGEAGEGEGWEEEPCEVSAPIASQPAAPEPSWLCRSGLGTVILAHQLTLASLPKSMSHGQNPNWPQHTCSPSRCCFPRVFPLFCILWESSSQHMGERGSREPAPGWAGASGFAAGAGLELLGYGELKGRCGGTPKPSPELGVPPVCLLLPDGLGEGEFQRISSHPKATSAACV